MLYRFDNFEIDADTFNLTIDGALQHVEPLVFDLLYFMVQNPDRIISRDEIIDAIWGGRIVSEATISSCIKSARKALGDSGDQQKYIKTIRGRGIQFSAQLEIIGNKVPSNSEEIGIETASHKPIKEKIRFNNLNFLYVIIGVLILIVGTLFLRPEPITTTPQSTTSINATYSIAVMPFTDLSEAGNQEYFGDGISEEILNMLTTNGQLNVTSRTTSFSLKGQNLSTPEIANKLGVNYIVEGSVRSSGSRIRITAQLIDAQNDIHMWSENYDRELNDIFAIQDEISLAIADALKVELVGDALNEETPTQNMEAYALYLQGHQYFLNRGMGDVVERIANLKSANLLLEQAVSIDPNFAEAWADLAAVYVVLPAYFPNEFSFKSIASKAENATNKAIKLQPNSSQAWSIRGFISTNTYQFEDAEQSLLKAIEFNANNETAWLWLNLHYSAVGNHVQAQIAAERAMALAPQSAINYTVLGLVHQASGNYEKAKELQEIAVDQMGFKLGYIDTALLALYDGDREQASTEMNNFLNSKENDKTSQDITTYINAYFDDNLKEDAAKMLTTEQDRKLFFGSLLLHDAKNMVRYFDTTPNNVVFNLRRIYYPIAKPLFAQQAFKDYIIRIGLLSYWKNHQFPQGCLAVGDNDFTCS